METQKPLLKDKDGEKVDGYMYRSMISSLMYLTSSRPDIMFVVCAHARYQVNPNVSHLYVMKSIFSSALLLWPKLSMGITESSVIRDLQLADEDGIDCLLNSTNFENLTLMGTYIAPSHTKKIFANMRRVGKDFSRNATDLFPTMLVQNQMGEGSAMLSDPQHTPTFIQLSPPPQKTQKPRKPKRKDTHVPQPCSPTYIIADEVVHKERGAILVRAVTSASSLEAEQDSGNITKTRSKATPNESSSLRTTSGGGPRCQETMGDTIAQTRFENVSKHSNDPLIARVLDLENTKTTRANEIDSLNWRVKKLEKRKKSRTHRLKGLYKVGLSARVESSDDEESLGEDASKQTRRIKDIDQDEDIILKKDQLKLDEKIAFKLQAEIDGDERIARAEEENIDEANIAWDDIHAKVDAD
ncbi:hypothetical protein Tco_0457719 [Tanacetum coccineum]